MSRSGAKKRNDPNAVEVGTKDAAETIQDALDSKPKLVTPQERKELSEFLCSKSAEEWYDLAEASFKEDVEKGYEPTIWSKSYLDRIIHTRPHTPEFLLDLTIEACEKFFYFHTHAKYSTDSTNWPALHLVLGWQRLYILKKIDYDLHYFPALLCGKIQNGLDPKLVRVILNALTRARDGKPWHLPESTKEGIRKKLWNWNWQMSKTYPGYSFETFFNFFPDANQSRLQ